MAHDICSICHVAITGGDPGRHQIWHADQRDEIANLKNAVRILDSRIYSQHNILEGLDKGQRHLADAMGLLTTEMETIRRDYPA